LKRTFLVASYSLPATISVRNDEHETITESVVARRGEEETRGDSKRLEETRGDSRRLEERRLEERRGDSRRGEETRGEERRGEERRGEEFQFLLLDSMCTISESKIVLRHSGISVTPLAEEEAS
jgi:hypothetical protein